MGRKWSRRSRSLGGHAKTSFAADLTEPVWARLSSSSQESPARLASPAPSASQPLPTRELTTFASTTPIPKELHESSGQGSQVSPQPHALMQDEKRETMFLAFQDRFYVHVAAMGSQGSFCRVNVADSIEVLSFD